MNSITSKELKAINQFYKAKGLKRLFKDDVFTGYQNFENITFTEEAMIMNGFNVYHYFDNFEVYAIKDNQVVLFNEENVIAELIKYNQVKKIVSQ